MWSVLIVGLPANAVLRASSFEAAAVVPCGQFLVPVAEPVERALQRLDSRPRLIVVAPAHRGSKYQAC